MILPLVTAGICTHRDRLCACLSAARTRYFTAPRLPAAADALTRTLIAAGAQEVAVAAPHDEVDWLGPPLWRADRTLWLAPPLLLDDLAAVVTHFHGPRTLSAILARMPRVPVWRTHLQLRDAPPPDHDLDAHF